MSRNLWTIALVSALFALIAFWSTPGFPAVPMDEAPRPASGELAAVADLAASLGRALRAEQERSADACDFVGARDAFLRVRDTAVRGARDLGRLWRAGRLRAGGLALTEVLLGDLGAIADESQRGATIAHALAGLRQLAFDGAPDARARLDRMVAIHPAPPACLTETLAAGDLGRIDETEAGSLETTLSPRPRRN